MPVTIKRKQTLTPTLDSPSPEGEVGIGSKENINEFQPVQATNILPFPEKLSALIQRVFEPTTESDFIPLVGPSKWLEAECQNNTEYRIRYEKVLADIALCKTVKALKVLYPAEGKAHDNEKYRAKTLDPRISDLPNWLIHMGPRPHVEWSVDRINPKKGYLVGNMRWAPPQTQTENRRVTKWHSLPDGRQMTTAELARYLGIKYDTLRKALSRGKSVQQLLDDFGPRTDTEHSWSFPPQLHSKIEPIYRDKRKAGQSRLAWFCGYLPRVFDELEAAKAPASRVADLDALYKEAKKELEDIRQRKKVAKHHLAFSILDAVSPLSKPLEQVNPFASPKPQTITRPQLPDMQRTTGDGITREELLRAILGGSR